MRGSKSRSGERNPRVGVLFDFDPMSFRKSSVAIAHAPSIIQNDLRRLGSDLGRIPSPRLVVVEDLA